MSGSDTDSDEMTYEASLGKGDQGDSRTCVRFALANALASHLHKHYGMVIDVDEAAGSFVNFYKHLDGMVPTEFNNQKILIRTKDGSLGDVISGTWARFHLQVEKVKAAEYLVATDGCEYIITARNFFGGQHAVYVEEQKNNCWVYVNSHSAKGRSDPLPIDEEGNRLYRAGTSESGNPGNLWTFQGKSRGSHGICIENLLETTG